MNPERILYLSTNATWGGSEILWCESAKQFCAEDVKVLAGAYFDYKTIAAHFSKPVPFIDLGYRFAIETSRTRILRRLHLKKVEEVDRLREMLVEGIPDLAVLSLGNIKDGLPLMEFCSQLQIPFITIIHLVAEHLWSGMDDKRIEMLNQLFDEAKANFFVSKHVWRMHEKLLGTKLNNAEVIYNPFIKKAAEDVAFPPVKDFYKVALIGRIENFHKGYDLLIDVVKQQKWRERNIQFSIFGKGPHTGLLKNTIGRQCIKNVFINDHEEDIAGIWKQHHILMMPSRMEGQSLTLIEAMHFKRAAIVTNVGGVDELIEDGVSGFIAKYPTVEHIDAALEHAWDHREQWKQMGETAYQQIKQKHPANAVGYFNEKLRSLIEVKVY